MFGNNGHKSNPTDREDEFDPKFAIGLAVATAGCILLTALFLLILR